MDGPTQWSGFDAARAADFAARWLPAWSGNRPELLVSFYTDDAFYADPGMPAGVRGRAALLAYFSKLLARFPDWVWTHRGSLPLADGFLNRWHASIPVADRVGLSCTPVGPAGTSIDCPPTASSFLATLNVVVPQLTSGVSSVSASDGLFCDGQIVPGAIGLGEARTVTEQGAGPTLAGTTLQMNLAGTFCIAPTGTFLDGIASLPGVGALSAVGQVEVSGLLLP